MIAGNTPTKLLILCILRGRKRDHLIIIKKHVTLKHIILIKGWSGGGHISGIIFLQCHTITRKLSVALRMIKLSWLISVDFFFSWVSEVIVPSCPISFLLLLLMLLCFYAQKDYLIIIVISPKYHEIVTNASFFMENDETLNTVYIHKQVQLKWNRM